MDNLPLDFSANIAEKIGEAIQKEQHSIYFVAEAAGLPYTTLNRRLKSRGTSPFTITELMQVCAVLNLNLLSLLEEIAQTGEPENRND